AVNRPCVALVQRVECLLVAPADPLDQLGVAELTSGHGQDERRRARNTGSGNRKRSTQGELHRSPVLRKSGPRGLADSTRRTSLCCPAMTTLAFNHEEIAPRELKPSLYELDGISRESVEAHYKLYQGYVAKRNEILS